MPVYDEFKKERESIKGQPFKKKLEYFWDYYKIHTIAAIFVIIVAAVFIRDIVNSKDYMYLCTFVNCDSVWDSDEFMEEFAKTTDIDLSKYYVTLDDSTHFSEEGYDENSMASLQKFMAMAYTGEIDNAVMPLSLYENYSETGMFLELKDVLTKEQLEKYKDHLYYYNDVPMGVILDEDLNDKICGMGFYPESETIIFGFMSGNHVNYGQQFLDWLTQN